MAQFQPIRITIAAVDKISATFRRIEGRMSGFRSKLAAVGAAAARIGSAMTAMGIAAAYAGARLVTGFIDKASGLVDAADRIGITAERFQELTLVAGQFGVTQGQLEIGLRKFVKEVGPVEENLGAFADRLAAIKDQSTRAKILVKAFGRSGQSLGPLFKEGSRGVEAMVDEFHRLGAVQSEDTLRRAESLGDAFERIKASLGGAVGAGFTAFLPSLESASKLTEKWFQDPANQQRLRDTFASLAKSFGTIAKATAEMAPTLETLASIVGFFSTRKFNPFGFSDPNAPENMATPAFTPGALRPSNPLEGRIVVEVRDRDGYTNVRTISNAPGLFMALEEKYGPVGAGAR